MGSEGNQHIQPYRPMLRKLIREHLRTDGDLNAFCLDHFPEVHERFSSGMDRLSKVNLLLEFADLNDVAKHLREHIAPLSVGQTPVSISAGQPDAEHAQARRDELEQLYIARERLRLQGLDTSELNRQISDVRRKQRQVAKLQEGEVLQDRYRLLEVVGRGGFATVWQAMDRQTHRLVAVKILTLEHDDDVQRIERFKRGARQMQGLAHPNVVRVLEGPDQYHGFHFFVMEYLPGGDLSRAILNQTINRETAMGHVLQIGSALAFAHQRGLIHRDVKPQNIMLDGRGTAFLGDFDLVWVPDSTGGTRTGAMGTFLYGAPEEMEDASRVDRRADIYSLAMTTIFVLHGKALPRQVLETRALFIDRLPCSDGVKALLRAATAFDPDDRPSTIDAFCRQLIALLPSVDAEDLTSIKEHHEAAPQPAKAVAPPVDRTVIAQAITPEPTRIHNSMSASVSQPPARSNSSSGIGLIPPSDLALISRPAARTSEPQRTDHAPMVPAAISQPAHRSSQTPVVSSAPRAKGTSRRTMIVAGAAAILVGGCIVLGLGLSRQSSSEPEIAQLTAEIEIDLQGRRWTRAIDKANRILSMPSLSSKWRSLAQAGRVRAEQEANAQRTYERFTAAADKGSSELAMNIYRTIAAGSVYQQVSKEVYAPLFSTFISSHLNAAKEARILGRCTESDSHVQSILEIEPKHAGALALNAEVCSGAGRRLSSPTGPKSDSADSVLARAGAEYAAGRYDKAIQLASPLRDTQPEIAFRIIGASACQLKKSDLANYAYVRVGAAVRQYIQAVCERNSISLASRPSKIVD